jgi:hypothetical protein
MTTQRPLSILITDEVGSDPFNTAVEPTNIRRHCTETGSILTLNNRNNPKLRILPTKANFIPDDLGLNKFQMKQVLLLTH